MLFLTINKLLFENKDENNIFKMDKKLILKNNLLKKNS